MSEKQKTLICGDVNGKFNALFTRVSSIVKKSGPFDALLCAGNFFNDDNSELDAYKMGTKKVPVTTYVFGPTQSEHVQYYGEEGSEIAPNVIYVGRRGLFTSSSEVKIAYLSGLSRHERGGAGAGACEFEPSDCGAVRDACQRGGAEYRGVDVLLTSAWPAGALQHTQKVSENILTDIFPQIDIEQSRVSSLVSWLSVHVKPRYHFVPSPHQYYERQPYRNMSVHQDYRECATRLIALAPVGNGHKQKWLYAVSLQPIGRMRMAELLQPTTDETPCPYSAALLHQQLPGKAVKWNDNGQFFYNMEAEDDPGHGKRRKRNDDDNKFDPDSCWFCLSSPSVQKQLVVSVGRHCYLALAKGPLTPHHVLVLPIAHYQATTKAPDEVVAELRRWQAALARMCAGAGQAAVFFERNYRTSHMQLQCVPVPAARADSLLEVFQDEGAIAGVRLEELPPHSDLRQVALPGAAYFHAALPGGRQLLARPGRHFPLQFGRDVLASPPLLNCEDKADWRACRLSAAQEAAHVAALRDMFAPYDFTRDDDSD